MKRFVDVAIILMIIETILIETPDEFDTNVAEQRISQSTTVLHVANPPNRFIKG